MESHRICKRELKASLAGRGIEPTPCSPEGETCFLCPTSLVSFQWVKVSSQDL